MVGPPRPEPSFLRDAMQQESSRVYRSEEDPAPECGQVMRRKCVRCGSHLFALEDVLTDCAICGTGPMHQVCMRIHVDNGECEFLEDGSVAFDPLMCSPCMPFNEWYRCACVNRIDPARECTMLVGMPGMRCVRCTHVSEEGQCGCPCDMCTLPAIAVDFPAIERWRSREGPSQDGPRTRGRIVHDFRASNRQVERSHISMPDFYELTRLVGDGRETAGYDPEEATVLEAWRPHMPGSLF